MHHAKRATNNCQISMIQAWGRRLGASMRSRIPCKESPQRATPASSTSVLQSGSEQKQKAPELPEIQPPGPNSAAQRLLKVSSKDDGYSQRLHNRATASCTWRPQTPRSLRRGPSPSLVDHPLMPGPATLGCHPKFPTQGPQGLGPGLRSDTCAGIRGTGEQLCRAPMHRREGSQQQEESLVNSILAANLPSCAALLLLTSRASSLKMTCS